MSYESKPISIEDFKNVLPDLSDDEIIALKQRLETSLIKLIETNSLLEQEIANLLSNSDQNDITDKDKESLQVYKIAISDNNTVISNQNERFFFLEKELNKRGIATTKSSEAPQVEKRDIYI